MQIGISTWCLRQQPLEEALTSIAALGIVSLELFANIFHLDPRSVKADVQRLSGVLKRNGLVPASIHAPFAKIDGGGSKIAAERVWKRLMGDIFALMASLRIPTVIVHPQAQMLSAGKDVQPLDFEQALLGEVIGQAHKQGIDVLLENLNPLNASAFHTLDEIGDLLRSMKDTRSGLCLDTSHCIIGGQDPAAEFNKNHGRIRQIHVSDNLHGPPADRHLTIGAGCIHWPTLISSLRQKRFDGTLMLEIDGGKHPDEALRRSLAALDAFMERN